MKSIYFQSVIKMSNKEEQQRTPCVLEISDKGIKMVDKSKPGVRFTILHSWLWGQNIMHWQDGNGVPSNEYFYNLKNVTFCGFHPRDHRYFGFITKVRDHTCDVSRVTCHVAAPQPVSAAVRLPRVPGRVEHAVRGPGLRVSHGNNRNMSWWCRYSAAGEPSDASTRSLSRQLSPRRIFIWSRSTECHRAAELVPVVPLPDGNCIFLVMCSSFILRARPGHGFTRPPVRIQILILLWKHNYGVGVSQRIWFSISTIQAHIMFMSTIYSQQVGAKTKMFIWRNCNVTIFIYSLLQKCVLLLYYLHVIISTHEIHLYLVLIFIPSIIKSIMIQNACYNFQNARY